MKKNIKDHIISACLVVLFANVINAQNNNSSFRLEPGEKYILNAWVKESATEQQTSYSKSAIVIAFAGGVSGSVDFTFTPTGNIIDGWQRIAGEFVVPVTATSIQINLNNNSSLVTSYFDDVRVFPFNGSMKSFVYDPETQRLMAELDENNYATLYEYDSEGGLVRVKKETEKGIYTIQETRSGNSKINSQNQ